MQTLGADRFREIILTRRPLLDVRAPVEFEAGHIPGSINIPILNNEERHEIGTIYKAKGNEAAVRRGHELVSGDLKAQRIAAWADLALQEKDLVLTCFRGGMRSRLAQEWLALAGVERPRIEGGYKAFRQFLLSELERLSSKSMRIVSGATGAGKTVVIHAVKDRAVDLEELAHHRGSAFGGFETPQPSQVVFENHLSRTLMDFEDANVLLLEDESRMVGKIALPEKLFAQMRASPVVMVEESLASRVELTFESYILGASPNTLAGYAEALNRISRKLGGARFAEVLLDLQNAMATKDLSAHKVWIEKILNWYYDPLYLKSLEKRQPKIEFWGSRLEVIDWLSAASAR